MIKYYSQIIGFKIILLSVLLLIAYGQLIDSEENYANSNEKISNFNFTDIYSGPCNIPVETELITQEEFIQKYAYVSPVIFKRNNKNERNKLFKEKCEIDNLYKEYGDKYVTVSSANTYSYKRYSMKLRDYLDKYVISNPIANELYQKLKYGNESWYFFGENNFTEWSGLISMYEAPNYYLPKHRPAFSFGIASALTGVPFHFHGPGFAETLVGRKRWFLYHPSFKPDFDPDQSTISWYFNVYKNLKPETMPMECVLDPLDVIYFPDRFWHATLNVDNSVFISTFLGL